MVKILKEKKRETQRKSDFSRWFRRKKCVFVSRPMKIVTFLLKNGDHPKRVVDFPRERDTFPKQNHGNRRGF